MEHRGGREKTERVQGDWDRLLRFLTIRYRAVSKSDPSLLSRDVPKSILLSREIFHFGKKRKDIKKKGEIPQFIDKTDNPIRSRNRVTRYVGVIPHREVDLKNNSASASDRPLTHSTPSLDPPS